MEKIKVIGFEIPSEMLKEFLFEEIGEIETPTDYEIKRAIVKVDDYVTELGYINEELYKTVLGIFYIDYCTARKTSKIITDNFNQEVHKRLDNVKTLDELVILIDDNPIFFRELLASALLSYILKKFMGGEFPYIDEVHKEFNNYYEVESILRWLNYKIEVVDEHLKALITTYQLEKDKTELATLFQDVKSILNNCKKYDSTLYNAIVFEILGTYINVIDYKEKQGDIQENPQNNFINYHLINEVETIEDVVLIFEHPYCQELILETYFDSKENMSEEIVLDYETPKYQKIRKLFIKKEQ